MKFQVAKRDLDEAIALVSNSISVTPDISGHFLFRRIADDNGRLEVRTCSGRLSSGCPFVATVEGEGEFTIEGKRLKAFLGSVDDGVLTFDADSKGLVEVVAPGMGTQHFQGLDPTPFPHWDQLLEKAKLTATIPASRLAEALAYARPFASTDEARTPHLCVCEARGGVMASSNAALGAGVYLFVPHLKDATIRVHVKDTGAILAFLSRIEVGDVEIRETERVAFYVRPDGAILGESRLNVEYPKIKVPPASDKHWWKIDTARALKALPFLKSGASEENLRIRLSRPDPDGPIKFSMLSKTGKVSEVDVACFDSGKADGVADMPSGFHVGYNPLLKLLELHRDQTEVTLGITALPPVGGYLRVVDDKFTGSADGSTGVASPDQYITVVAWLK